LTKVLDGMAKIAQPKWVAWRRKQRLEGSTPESFGDLLSRCLTFADPALGGAVSGSTWNASLRAWE
jgi:hypothetical protein